MILRGRRIFILASLWLFLGSCNFGGHGGGGTRSFVSASIALRLRGLDELVSRSLAEEIDITEKKVNADSVGEPVSAEGDGTEVTVEGETSKPTNDEPATTPTSKTDKKKSDKKTSEAAESTVAPAKDEKKTQPEPVAADETKPPTEDEDQTKPVDKKTEPPSAATDAPDKEAKTSPPEDDVDPCAGATDCAECVSKALNLSTTASGGETTCVWKKDKCKKAASSSSEIPSIAKMCEENITIDDESQEDDLEGGGISSSFVILLFLVGGFMLARAYSLQQSGQLPAGFGWQPPAPQGQRASPRGLYTERVPLATSHDDDEWGWEDSDAGGDVELATRASRHKQKEDEDLQMALAMSLSEKTKKSSSGGSSRNVTGRSESSEAWDDRNSVPTSTGSPPRTSVGLHKKMQPSRKREEKPKTQEEDIFASMGLSAKPTFSRSSDGKQAGGRSAPTSGSSALAATDVDLETGSDWGDDSDLDDLLND